MEKLPWGRVSARLKSAYNYWLGTTRPDGRPHVVPVWGVWFEEAFYFGTARHTQKARNLGTNPAMVVHLESGDDVVILEGEAEEVTDAALFARIDDAFAGKHFDSETGEPYRFEEETSGEVVVFALRPRTAHAWLEGNFAGSASRWRFA